MTNTVTCGQALVRLLEAYGVDTVFGIPGVHTIELYRGLEGSPIRHILPRHEQGAGFMADGYARASGRPGVCFLITGPGLTNAATAVGQAYSDSVPMLVVSTVLGRADMGKGYGRLHEITDQRAVMAPLCAFSATAMAPGEVPGLVARAFAVFSSGRPRPVHIEIPLDVIGAATEGGWQPAAEPGRPAPDTAAVAAAAGLLMQAERPLVIAGGGAIAAAADVRRIAETIGAAVITTLAGKGIVPDGHSLSLGATLPRAATQDFAAAADVVLVMGSELASTDHWRDRLKLEGRIIRVDIDAGKLADTHAPEVAIHADAAQTARLLADALSRGRAAEAKRTIADIKQGILDGEKPLRRLHRRVLSLVRECLPADTLVTSDMTQIAYAGNEVFATTVPGTWLHPAGFSTLGYAVPAALGAKVAAPRRPVAAIVGDGGFQFTLQELATAAELDLSLPILLWNNDALGEIRDNMIARGMTPIGVESRNPDFQALAAAFGCRASKPESPDALQSALGGALDYDGVTLIEVLEERARRWM